MLHLPSHFSKARRMQWNKHFLLCMPLLSVAVMQLTFVVLNKQTDFCIFAVIDWVWKRPIIRRLHGSVTCEISNIRFVQASTYNLIGLGFLGGCGVFFKAIFCTAKCVRDLCASALCISCGVCTLTTYRYSSSSSKSVESAF